MHVLRRSRRPGFKSLTAPRSRPSRDGSPSVHPPAPARRKQDYFIDHCKPAMSRYAEVTHREWIAAPVDTVRAQFADLDHHIRRNVHPRLRFEVLQPRARGARFAQEGRLLGIRQRDVFERRLEVDGSIVGRVVEGFNRGGYLCFRFTPQAAEGRRGTEVEINICLPLPPVVGVFVRPLLEAQIRKEVRAASREDKRDIEALGYPEQRPAPAAA